MYGFSANTPVVFILKLKYTEFIRSVILPFGPVKRAMQA